MEHIDAMITFIRRCT